MAFNINMDVPINNEHLKDPLKQEARLPGHQKFWQDFYERQAWPWDLGGPSPHFERFFNGRSRIMPDLLWLPTAAQPNALTPGAGRGHDGVYLASQGFNVTCVDYASGAPAAAQEAYPHMFPDPIAYKVADIFSLSDDAHWQTRFDLLLEHTCFCAISPKRRPEYVKMADWTLKPGGMLLGVFWNFGPGSSRSANDPERPNGPPFSITPEEVETYFGEKFECVGQETAPAAGDRPGEETLMLWRKR